MSLLDLKKYRGLEKWYEKKKHLLNGLSLISSFPVHQFECEDGL